MSLILTEQKDGVFTIRFNRADKKNALTQAMYLDLCAALEKAKTDPQTRVLLFAGQPDCFSAGNDMKDFLSVPLSSGAEYPTIKFMSALSEFPKPVVAAPCGIAVGIGVTLLLHCDLVYCGEQTTLNLPFVNIGIRPEFVSSYLLPRIMGHVRACELVLLGEPFTAQKALEYGLVNALAPNAEVENLAREKTMAIAKLPPHTVRSTKALLKRWRADVTRQAIPLEMSQVAESLRHPEALEAINSFIQKRKPDFSKFT